MPYRIRRILPTNTLFILNIVAIVIVDERYRDLFTLRWCLQIALLVQVSFRWPDWLRSWHD